MWCNVTCGVIKMLLFCILVGSDWCHVIVFFIYYSNIRHVFMSFVFLVVKNKCYWRLQNKLTFTSLFCCIDVLHLFLFCASVSKTNSDFCFYLRADSFFFFFFWTDAFVCWSLSLFSSLCVQLCPRYGPQYTSGSEKALPALSEPDPCKASLQGARAAQMCQPQKCKDGIFYENAFFFRQSLNQFCKMIKHITVCSEMFTVLNID